MNERDGGIGFVVKFCWKFVGRNREKVFFVRARKLKGRGKGGLRRGTSGLEAGVVLRQEWS